MGGRVPLPWRNVTANPRKFALSVIGVTFAVVLMFAEMGFLTGVINAQARVLEKLGGDLALVNRAKASMFVVDPFPRARLAQVAGHPAVARTMPIHVAMGLRWKDPDSGRERPLRLLAFDPDQPAFRDPEVAARRAELTSPGAILLDRGMASYFGAREVGRLTELQGQAVRVAGTFDMGVDLPARGTAIVSDRTLLRLLGAGAEPSLDEVEIGLVDLVPDADPAVVLRELRAALPDDVLLMTRDQLLDRERLYFLTQTPIGVMFALGLVMGAIVAGFICYQILYADVLANLGQYATLKAMGYTTPFIVRVVVLQALYLATLGFVAGTAVATGLYRFLAASTSFPMEVTPARAGVVFGLSLAACGVAAILAAKRPIAADPADAF